MKRVLTNGKIKKVKKSDSNVVKRGDHWVNKGMIIVKSIPCIIPRSIENLMLEINKHFIDTEFSIFAKSFYDEEKKRIIVEKDYYIPKQEVTMAGVDYNEGPPEGFNTVIHKHPTGCTSFSPTDDTYINQNHDYSLLWEGGRFISGQVRFRSMFGMTKLPMIIERESLGLEVVGLDNISRRKVHVTTVGGKRFGNFGSCEDYTDYLHKDKKSGKSNHPYIGPHGNNHSWDPEPNDGWKNYGTAGKITKDHLEKEGFLNPELEQVQSELLNGSINEADTLDDYVEEVEAIMLENGVGWEKAVTIHADTTRDDFGFNIKDVEGTFGL